MDDEGPGRIQSLLISIKKGAGKSMSLSPRTTALHKSCEKNRIESGQNAFLGGWSCLINRSGSKESVEKIQAKPRLQEELKRAQKPAGMLVIQQYIFTLAIRKFFILDYAIHAQNPHFA